MSAWALAAFCICFQAYLAHFQPEDQMQMISFMKNLAIAGGFLALAVSGPGAWSIDARRSAA
jgi:putative oxidoreductase